MATMIESISAVTLATPTCRAHDLYSSEIEMKMTWQMGIQWWPKNATAYVEKFISRASGEK
jgi:hypothetical protein